MKTEFLRNSLVVTTEGKQKFAEAFCELELLYSTYVTNIYVKF